MAVKPTRCGWVSDDLIEQEYHDKQWGIPVFEDKQLFKMLCLESMQAGLSWRTILRKMDALCLAYDNFDPEIIVHYDENKEAALLQNKEIIRHRLKVKSVVTNAVAYFQIREEFGTFSHYLWSFVNYQPIINTWESMDQVPAQTALSQKISKDLKKRGFKFVGPTIIYAFMQATGMVNDHLIDCSFRKVSDVKVSDS